MSTVETKDHKSLSAQAVDEEYEKLQKLHVESRRIVLLGDKDSPEGGFGVVRRGELYQSAYLPAGSPHVDLAHRSVHEGDVGVVKPRGASWDRQVSRLLRRLRELKSMSPWEPNGNVSEFFKTHKLEVPEKLSLVYDTIDALEFLHKLEPPVCHGDIKSANVLISAEYKARLCNFGLARLHEDSGFGRLDTSTGNKASIRWCSPELIDGATRGPTSDVYAWAWLVWEIMTGMLPYGDTLADFAIIRRIFESPIPQADGASRLSDCLQLWDLMMRCWNFDPQQRPTARMCKTTVTNLPRCNPIPANADHQARSAALLENLGDLENWKGNLEKSSTYLDEALQLYREQAETRGIASVLRKQAVAARRYSDFLKAIAKATAALEHFRNLNDPLGIADASLTLGDSLYMQDRDDEALSAPHDALDIYRAHGNDIGAALCSERIGELQRWTSKRNDALSTLEEAVAIASRSGDRLALARGLNSLGRLHIDRNDYDRATETLTKARPIAQSIGWYAGLSDIERRLGYIKMRLGNYREAKAFFQDSVSSARQGRARWELAHGLWELGGCFQKQLKLTEAVSTLGESCLLFRELSRPGQSVQIAATLIELKTSQGDWDSVLFWHDHIISVSRAQKEHRDEADHLVAKGEILVKAQRYDEAALHFEAAMVTRGENGYREWR